MKYKCYIDGSYVGSIYAPNAETALIRAVNIYGLSVDIEEK